MTGQVVDYDTGEPIQGAEVITGSAGWGINNGTLIWDKEYSQQTVTEENGSFQLQAEVGSMATFRINKEGYAYHLGRYDSAQPVRIQLKSIDPNDVLLRIDMMQVGYKEGRPYGWIFSKGQTTFDPTEADIIPVPQTKFERNRITLTTPGDGGIQSLSVQELGIQSDFLVYADVAPDTGYDSQVSLNIESGSADHAYIYFVRTRDGNHYAKFLFNPASFSAQKTQQRSWDILFESVYNPEDSRKLIYRR